MKSLTKFTAALLTVLLSSCSVNRNPEITIHSDGSTEKSTKYTIEFDKDDKMSFQVLSDTVTEFINNYDMPGSSDEITDGSEMYYPNDLTVSWTYEGNPDHFVFLLSDNKKFTDAAEYLTYEPTVTLKSLFIGTEYHYRVDAYYEDYIIQSHVNTFTTDDTIRTIKVENVSNTRDIGGAYCEDGKHRMKQGVCYRGANIDSISESGKDYMVNELGIKSDVDLRGPDDIASFGGVSPLGENVTLYNYGSDTRGCPYYTGSAGIGSGDSVYTQALLNHLKVFADKNAYPIYFHCAIGRDRTGTIAFLLESLCGLPLKRVYLDYEFSFFSSSGHTTGTSATYFANNGLRMLYSFIYYYGDGTMAENTEDFLLNLGLTSQEISSIKSNLLEEVK